MILLLVFVLFSLGLEAKPLNVNISAKSAVLINAETGAVLYEKQAQIPFIPASLSKIPTAFYALEKKGNSLEDSVVVSREAVGVLSGQVKKQLGKQAPAYRLTTDGTHMGLKVGEVLPLRALFYGLMLVSGNDAANVIAEHVSGDIGRFVEELNVFMKEKGCVGTRFSNPHGLHHGIPLEEHVTTARDLAKLTQEALKNPHFREIVKTQQYTRPATNKQPESILYQHNRLMRKGPYYYPKAIGVKTGYTDKAWNLVAAAEDGGRTLIAVLLGCSDNYQRFRDAIALFEGAFAEKKYTRTLFTKEFDRFTLAVKGGKTALEGGLSEDLKISYFPSEEPELKAMLRWNDQKLPIRKGVRVGEIQLLSSQGKIFQSASLYASKEVEMTAWHQIGRWTQTLRSVLFQNRTLILVILSSSLIFLFYYLRKPKAA